MNLLHNIQLTDETLTIEETASVLRIISLKKVSTYEEIEIVKMLCSGFTFGTYKTLNDLKKEALDIFNLQIDYCLDFYVTKEDVLKAYNAVLSSYHNSTEKEVMKAIFGANVKI